MTCPYCGVEVRGDDLLHVLHCDGQQGAVEAGLYGQQGDVPFEQASETSALAADSISSERLARLEAEVLAVIAKQPSTCDEVEVITGLAHQTASARIRGLVLRDRVTNSGARRKTRSGRLAVVWQTAPSTDRKEESDGRHQEQTCHD